MDPSSGRPMFDGGGATNVSRMSSVLSSKKLQSYFFPSDIDRFNYNSIYFVTNIVEIESLSLCPHLLVD
jgi:hypothetical protein